MAIGAPWVGTPIFNTGNGITTLPVDVSGATVGEWMYVHIVLSDSDLAGIATPAGWTLVHQSDQTRSHHAWFRRKKVTGDTGVSFSWATSCRYHAVAISWPGLDPTTPDEGAATLNHDVSGISYPTPSVTPTAADRWAAMSALARTGTVGNKVNPWTPDAALTERLDANTGANASGGWINVEIADSNGAVTLAAHSYTATATIADSNGSTVLFYLIPAPAGGVGTSGSAVLGFSGSGTASKVAAVGGSCSMGFTGTASARKVAVETGRAVVGLATAAAAAKKTAQTGLAAVGLAGTHSGVAARQVTGILHLGLAATGVARKTATGQGTAVLTLAGTAADRKVQAARGVATLGATVTGTAAKHAATTGVLTFGLTTAATTAPSLPVPGVLTVSGDRILAAVTGDATRATVTGDRAPMGVS